MNRLALYVVLVDRCGDHGVNLAVAHVSDGALEGGERGGSRLLGALSGFHLAVLVDHVDHIYHSVARLVGFLYLVHLLLLHAERLAVERGYLGRTIYHRSAELEYAVVVEHLEYHLVAYAVDIAVRDTYLYVFILFHFVLY